MRILLFLLLLISLQCAGQTVSVWETVEVKAGYKAEALYFYEHNWKLYRDIALKKGVITAYRLDQSLPDSTQQLTFFLITEYRDSLSYKQSEDNFRDILKAARPDGPLLMNQVQPALFRKSLSVHVTSNLFRSAGTQAPADNPGHLE